MSGAAGDVARMLALVPWLLERPGASVSETAEAFDVDERVIRRDLQHLDFCGLPGLGGGDLFEVDIVGDRIVVGMADELRRPLRPTPTEALRLVLTVDAVAELLGEELPALRSAVDKIRTALGVPSRLADVLADEPSAHLVAARRAVADGKQVRLVYRGRADDEPRERDVDPWGLRVEDGLWYLQGFDHHAGGARVFRMDRVLELEVSTDPVRIDAPVDLPLPRYRPSGDDLEVMLELSPNGRWLLDALDVDVLDEHADGSVRAILHTDAPGWIARLVLTAGGAVRVTRPASLRGQIARLARQALADNREVLNGYGR